MHWPISALFALAVFVAATPVLAASKENRDDCRQSADRERRIQGCTRIIEDLSEKPNERALAYNNRGVYWRNQGDYDRALADYTDAIKLNPKYAIALSNRGYVLLDKRENERAMADCDEAIKLAPKAAHGYGCRGVAFNAMGEYDRALTECDIALSIDPKYATGYNCRGFALFRKSEHDRAIADFSEAIKLSPRYVAAYNNRGRAHRANGNLDRAIEDFSEAILISPRYRAAFRNRGNAWAAKGDNARAEADFAEANRSVAAGNTADVAAAKPAPPAKPVAAAATATSRRVALVIGNSAYSAVPALANPQRDANSIASALRSVGFSTVTIRNDATRSDFVTALRRFEDEAEKADWAVVYYAGHGVELNGVNYLVPVDAKLTTDRDLQDEAVPLERVLSSVENAKKLRLVILDACRDNPFLTKMRRSVSTRSVGRGLGQIEPDGGVLVAYAAKHGQVALDGEVGASSPFATALVKRLNTPNLEISMLFRMVRDDVLNATAKKQEPFVYGSLPGEALYFVQK